MTPDNERFLAGLCSEVWLDGDEVHARMELQPSHLKPGTDRVRVGVLATMVDVIGGSPSFAILNPTVDLRVTLVDRLPSSGKLEFVCRPVRVGRRLFVSETIAHAGDEAHPFMRGICTFLNRVLEGITHDDLVPHGELGAENYDDLVDVREPEPGVYELDHMPIIGNPHSGTIIGGAQAIFAEIVAERALMAQDGREYEVVDLDVRYLNALRTPAIRARGDVLVGSTFDSRCVRIAMAEANDEERIVSLVSAVCRPVS